MKFKPNSLLGIHHVDGKCSFFNLVLNHVDEIVEQVRVYIPNINSWGFTSRVGGTDFRLIQ